MTIISAKSKQRTWPASALPPSDPVLRTIVGVTLVLVVLYVGMVALGADSQLATLPWFIPMTHGFGVLAAVTVAFLAFGRYCVLHDDASYWVGTAFAAFSVGSVFYILTWPGLRSDGGSILGQSPNTSACIITLGLALFGGLLLVSVRSAGERPPRTTSLRATLPLWVATFVILEITLIALERHLPILVGLGRMPNELIVGLILLFLFLSVAAFSIRRYRRTRDNLAAWVGLTSIILAFTVLGVALAGKRASLMWYAGHLLGVCAILVMMFGLLADYVRLYRSEREKTVQLEKSSREQQLSEAALRTSEEQYRLLFASNPNPMWVFDEETYRFLAVNDAAVKEYGWSNAEFLELTVLDVRPPEEVERVKNLIKSQRSVRESDIGVLRHRRKDGTPMSMQITVSSIVFNGRPGRLCCLVNVSERLKADVALRESEERFRLMFQSHRAIMLLIEPDTGVIVDANDAAAAFYGYPREKLRTLRIDQINQLPSEQLADARRKAVESSNGQFVFPHMLANGQTRWVEVYASPVVIQGKPLLFSVIHDITERRQAEEALDKAKADLERQNQELEFRVNERTASLQSALQELEHFSYCITHDMRAPLRAVRSYGELLVTEICANCQGPVGKNYLGRIMQAVERMDALIVDALDYGKIARAEFTVGPVDVAQLLRGVIESYPHLQADWADIRLEGEFPLVQGYGAGLTQCFSNILGNAVKFVAPGVKPKVRIWAETLDRQAPSEKHGSRRVRIWFEDNGIGIPKGCERKIFDMFQRLDANRPGTGIGLAIVLKSVQRMGGQVGVVSELGNGSRFWLELNESIQ